MDARLALTEHQATALPDDLGNKVVQAVLGLEPVLVPRIRPQAVQSAGMVEVRNLVGSVRLADGSILEVEPKVDASSDWPESVVQLLSDTSRISVTGSQRSRQGTRRRDLTSVIAFEYARRLERAIAREGPIQVFERHRHLSRRINGRLDVGAYTRNMWRDPAQFPVTRDELTSANDFSRGLSLVARSFRRSVSDATLTARLRRLESAAIPGHALPAHLDPAVAERRLPAQWANYRPAWDIAAAVLRNRSIINDPGHSLGLEVAVEPWPLLETLLERTLRAVERTASFRLLAGGRDGHLLLTQGGITAGEVVPDGVLRLANGHTVATFEAKYTRAALHPKEAHRYQALVAAAVLQSPVAVIVYPGSESPTIYDVHGFQGRPAKLATIGLDMYGYKRVGGAQTRAERLLQLLSATGAFRL